MSDPILVVIFLRGGADALNIVSPTSDIDYLAARPDALRVLRKGSDQGIKLGDRTLGAGMADVDFRLNPAAKGLGELFQAGDLSFVHATGLREATRSHFDAEARIERAATVGAAGGWLGRWLNHARPMGQLPAMAVGTSLPESLRGSRAAVAPDFSELMLAPGNWLSPALRARLAAGFGHHSTLGATTSEVLAVSAMLQDRLWLAESGEIKPYSPSVDYPENSELSAPLMTVAQSIKMELGLRIATVDYGGWDTHAHQASTFPSLLGALSASLMAFWRDLGPYQQDVSVVVQSEFGRRLRSNDSGGTDHGRAGAMMVLGPQSRGGRLLGNWPGLSNGALEEGADLAVTTDYRDVLAEVLVSHMGLSNPEIVFPGLFPSPLGLFG